MKGRALALLFAIGSAVAVVLVVLRARHDSADPARCGVLVPMAGRCCAPGQNVVAGLCRGRPSHCPAPLELLSEGCAAPRARALIAGGTLHTGPMDWEAHGRVTPHDAVIAPFELDVYEITEAAYAECSRAGRCAEIALSGEPGRAATGITRAEARTYCAFRGGRLPTEDEWTWAAAGSKSRRYPWGDTGAVCRRGSWGLRDGPCGYGGTGAEVAGAHPDGQSPEGVMDLSGNAAEWVEAPGGVRGGSWASGFAAELRTWNTRSATEGERSAEIGARCAYDLDKGQ